MASKLCQVRAKTNKKHLINVYITHGKNRVVTLEDTDPELPTAKALRVVAVEAARRILSEEGLRLKAVKDDPNTFKVVN